MYTRIEISTLNSYFVGDHFEVEVPKLPAGTCVLTIYKAYCLRGVYARM